MRKFFHIAFTAVFAAGLTGPVVAHETRAQHAEAIVPAASTPAATAALPMVKGEVVTIDESTGKIQLKHDAISNLGMGAMSMVFKASDPAMLKTVKVGDKVNFQADKVNGQITVMKVEKSK